MTNIQTTILIIALRNIEHSYRAIPQVGICRYIYDAYPYRLDDSRAGKAAKGLTNHIAKLLHPHPYLYTWLLAKGHITAKQYDKIRSYDFEMLSQLRATRIAWIKHLIKQSKTKYLS